MMLAVLLEDGFLPLSVTSIYVFSIAKTFLYLETKNLWSRVPPEKLGVAQQVIVLYGS
jgi:hypothetical protein